MQLVLENIDKAFDDKQLFNDVTFKFETGKIYGLLGRNGSGKTTLFNYQWIVAVLLSSMMRGRK